MLLPCPDLVEGVDLLPICGEVHEAGVEVDQAADDEVFLADPGLLGAAELSSPHHVAVTALYTAGHRK